MGRKEARSRAWRRRGAIGDSVAWTMRHGGKLGRSQQHRERRTDRCVGSSRSEGAMGVGHPAMASQGCAASIAKLLIRRDLSATRDV